MACDITDEALQSAAYLAARYVPDRFLPDKAIDLMDEAASRVRIYKVPVNRGLRDTLTELRDVQRNREQAYSESRYDEATDLRERESDLAGSIAAVAAELEWRGQWPRGDARRHCRGRGDVDGRAGDPHRGRGV